jgi:hypothetical protein
MMLILEMVGSLGGAGTDVLPRMTPEEYGTLKEIPTDRQPVRRGGPAGLVSAWNAPE